MRRKFIVALLATIVVVAAGAAQATPALELLFDDAVPLGSNLTSTPNTGTGGGTATGQAFGNGSLTYTVGPGGVGKAALFTDANAPGGINPHGGRIDVAWAGSVDFTLMMMVRRDGDQTVHDRLFEMVTGQQQLPPVRRGLGQH